MKITWLGHSGFRIEIGDQILLIDPWLAGNPVFPEDRREEAVAGATHILVSHGHFDHATDAAALSKETGAPIVAIAELAGFLEATESVSVVGFNKGGTVALGDVSVTMVNAVHSSSTSGDGGPIYSGGEAGFMISHGGRTIYFSGDTDVTADMGVMQALHAPEIGILCCGGHFTMDMRRAAYAARTFFDFKTVIPCHYKTFPLLAQSAQPLADALPGIDVQQPDVMETLEL
ncbi:metal-dependent hydrolase [Rhodovulum sp. 12E13]|uniref:metal-dependent hydrolase n=1 Tax=Rhodovulum sp. 12E13 TaxID=2203891 RepID=UPI000E12C6E5|nr:metal-dependent hydrolase [Rhodovulum sp. 12E13]RDC72806.1 metal-dependent hydrolase [Rhodovulum sp. 12E13]